MMYLFCDCGETRCVCERPKNLSLTSREWFVIAWLLGFVSGVILAGIGIMYIFDPMFNLL